MRKHVSIFLALFVNLCSMAQGWQNNYDEIGMFENGVSYVSKGGRYGYVDQKGKEIIPCIFTAVGSFNSYGLVWVNNGGSFGDESSGIVGGLFGVYNREGKVVLPVKYRQLGYFDSSRSTDGNPYAKFRSLAGFDYGNSRYSADVENRTLMKNKGLEWVAKSCGCFDVHEPVPFVAEPFCILDMQVGNCFLFTNSTNNPHPSMLKGEKIYTDETMRGENKWGIADANGNIVLPLDKFDFCYNPSEGYVPVVKIEKGIYTINYFNIETHKLQFPNYLRTLSVAPVCGGKVMIVDESGCQFMDMEGNRIGELYDAILPSKDADIYTVYKNSLFGIIDKHGKELVPISFRLISTAQEGLVSFVSDGANGKPSYGYMDMSGNQIVEPMFSSVYHFENGTAMVRQGDKYGCIDNKGKMVFPCRYAAVFPAGKIGQEIYFIQEEKNSPIYAYKAYTDKRLYQLSFSSVRNYGRDYDDVAFVAQKSQSGDKEFFGCVSSDGEMIIPCLCNSYEEAMLLYFNRMRDGYTKWTMSDTNRYKKKVDPWCNYFKLHDTIQEQYWDY